MISNPPRKKRKKHLVVWLPANRRMGEQRLDLRCEEERSPGNGVIKRFYARTVPGTEERAPALIPYSKCPHPVEPVQAVSPPLLVGVQDDTGIGRGDEPVTGSPEVFTEFGGVVDPTIKDDPERSILVCHRLPAIADREASMRKPDGTGEAGTLTIRAAMTEALPHGSEEVCIRLPPVQGKLPGDTAHTRDRSLVRTGLIQARAVDIAGRTDV